MYNNVIESAEEREVTTFVPRFFSTPGIISLILVSGFSYLGTSTSKINIEVWVSRVFLLKMAELVESRIEEMLPELEQMERVGLFKKSEIRWVAECVETSKLFSKGLLNRPQFHSNLG